MKIIANTFLFLFLGLSSILTSCDKDTDPAYNPTEDTPVSGMILSPETNKNYVLSEANKYEVFDTFSWSATQYQLPLGLKYTIEIDKEDGNFDEPVKLGTTSEREISFTVNVINDALNKLGLTPDEAADVKVRIVTRVYGGEEGNVLLENFPTAVSEPITITVTPFAPPQPAYPSELFMIGASFGNWDWTSADVVPMIPVHSKEGHFWCINYFEQNNGFKWAPAKKWANDFASLTDATGYTLDGGGNAVVAADGLYMVYINMVDSKIAIEPAQVYGIGDCFGGWTEGIYPFTVNGNKTSIVTTAGGTLRMYAASSIAISDWWTREFTIKAGKIVYRANSDEVQGGDTPNAGQTITLDFKTGTGTIN